VTHPATGTASGADGLHEVFSSLVRLRISALLSGCDEATFQHVQESSGLSKSALSKQVTTLERAGMVEVRKGYVGKYPRTWLALSPAGRAALREHLAALQRIASAASSVSASGR
jgi:DNA-binding MarR family transcriptional regulator